MQIQTVSGLQPQHFVAVKILFPQKSCWTESYFTSFRFWQNPLSARELSTIPSKDLSVILTTIGMREINHNVRLKGVNQKFEPHQSETFVHGWTKVFKIVGSVRKCFLPLSSPPPYFSFFVLALFLARPETRKWLFTRWKCLLRRLSTSSLLCV